MPRTRFRVLAVLIVLAGGALFALRAEAQAPPDLKRLALTVNDLGGGGWRMVDEEISDDGLGYIVTFSRENSSIDPPAALIVELDYDPAGRIAPAAAVEETLQTPRLLQQLFQPQTLLSYEFVPPALVGQDTAQARFTLQIPGRLPVRGDVLGWRRGAIVVTMTYLASSNSHVVPYAETQDARLVEKGPAR